MKRNHIRKLCVFALALALLAGAFCVTAFAAPDSVASAIEGTWTTAKEQIKTIVNRVVFPALDLILAVMFFIKVGATYFDYKKHGQLEMTAPIILFACLVFSIAAPGFVWKIID